MESLLVCPVCCTELKSPVTLSCGYTICEPCIPAPFTDRQTHCSDHPTFACPVKDCNLNAHLFCRAQQVHVDVVIKRILVILGKKDKPSHSKRARLLPSSSVTGNKIADLLNCPSCNTMFKDPITTHCGHVYCRSCLLKLKICNKTCMQCKSPLPQFNHFFNQAETNRILKQLVISQTTGISYGSLASHLALSCRRPIFVAGLPILPNQHVRLPIFTPIHLRMLRHAVFISGTRLLLAVVHRGRPTMAQVGTIVEITAVEHRKSGSLILDVIGEERFETSDIEGDYLQQPMKENLPLLTAQCTLIRAPQPRDKQERDDMEALADQIRNFLRQLAQSPPPVLLLGVLWFETMQGIHGPLPASGAENTLWWAAAVLPVSAAERYALLHTISLRDRLILVLSWIKQLDSQWRTQYVRQLLA